MRAVPLPFDRANTRQVLDYGAARDGVPARDRGRRIEVDQHGRVLASESDGDEDEEDDDERELQ